MPWFKYTGVVLTVSVSANDEADASNAMEAWIDSLMVAPPGVSTKLDMEADPYEGPVLEEA